MVPTGENVLESKWQQPDGTTRRAPGQIRASRAMARPGRTLCAATGKLSEVELGGAVFVAEQYRRGKRLFAPFDADPQQGVRAVPDDVERIVSNAQCPDRRFAAEFDVVGRAEARRRRRHVVGGTGQTATAVGLDPQVPRHQGCHSDRS